MRIAIGSDHAGFALKAHLIGVLGAQGHDVTDLGTESTAPVVLGGSGQGEQIAANKVHGVRAALCNDLYTARLSRAHNDANVLAIGARIVAPELAEEILRVWLETPFDAGRHIARIEQIAAIEQEEQTHR